LLLLLSPNIHILGEWALRSHP